MSEIVNLSRRAFLKTSALVGGGLLLGFYFPFGEPAAEAARAPFAPNAFLRIGPDGRVTFIIHKAEMGQGVYTSLPMLIAEELECDWRHVSVEPSPVAPVYNHTAFGAIMVTGGSSSVWSEWDRLSKAGAVARTMLVAAAARKWGVDPAGCRAENGRVSDGKGRSLTYGELAPLAAKMQVPKDVKPKEGNYRLLGTPQLRLDSPAKVNGTAEFGLDVRMPGLLTAVVARPPVFGATVKSFDAVKALKVPGVKKVVQVPSGVAVVATGLWSAKKGRDALTVTWDEGKWAHLDTPEMLKEYAQMAGTPGVIARKDGKPEQARSAAAKTITADYHLPYLAHATMEPLNCTVDYRGGESCIIRVGSQMQTGDRNAAARILGLKPEQVKLHTTFLGGGFGRRANPRSDFVAEAVEVAKRVRKPVKVVWTREDDMRGGYYRPMWYDRLTAGLDDKGNLTGWWHTIVGQSIIAGTPFEGAMVKNGIDHTSVEGGADIPYAIPNIMVDLHSPQLGVPVLWWRSVGHSHTAFVVESFLDETAHATGKDPFELRRALLADKPRHKGVLELAAEKAGWGKPLPAGHGRGIAVHDSFGSFVAQVAEVSTNPAGEIKVHRVVCAIDCGRIVNPLTIAAQMESAIVFGLSAALHGSITLKNGRVEQGNYDTYPVLRMNEMPTIEVHIAPSTEKPGGVGEPGVPPTAPAVTNALFAATGVRLRSLPITKDALRDEMIRMKG